MSLYSVPQSRLPLELVYEITNPIFSSWVKSSENCLYVSFLLSSGSMWAVLILQFRDMMPRFFG